MVPKAELAQLSKVLPMILPVYFIQSAKLRVFVSMLPAVNSSLVMGN